MNDLTFLLWWAYAVYVIAKSMAGFSIPVTRRIPVIERFFCVRNMVSFKFLWAVVWGTFGFAGTCSGMLTHTVPPTRLASGKRKHITAKQGVCHDCT